MGLKYFVTSTGTGIGKTYVTSALIRQARREGKTVAAFKPVISGFDAGNVAASDTGAILAALGEAPTPEIIDKISPWRLKAPLAPNMAARAEGRALDCGDIFVFSNKVLQEEYDLTLIEGVGGVMVPLDDKNTVLDWIVAAKAPVLLVVGDYLGTISHTLTAFEVLGARGAEIAAVIVNEGEGENPPFAETVAEIARWLTPVPALGLRRGEDGAALAGLLK